MADYRTHLIGAIVAGAGAASLAAWYGWTEPWRLPLVALVGVVGGLAPDLDSDNSRPVRILFNVATVGIPSALVFRMGILNSSTERAVVSWILLALFVRFPLCWLFKRFTVHRGIFHSVPAILIFGCFCFLVAGRHARDVERQIAFGIAGASGYLTHLLLDELWSVDFNGVQIRAKKSLGSALSLVGLGWASTVAAYGLLFLMGGLVWRGLSGVLPEDLWESAGLGRFMSQLAESAGVLTRLFREWLSGL